MEEVEPEAFSDLYYKRWSIETKYSQLKQKLELENFSGRLVENIKQDFLHDDDTIEYAFRRTTRSEQAVRSRHGTTVRISCQ
jgi:hypothetical protein